MSWRLWQREQLVVSDNEDTTAVEEPAQSQTLPKAVPSESRLQEVPHLSGSVESLADEETGELNSESAPLEIFRPRIQRLDSTTSSRSKRERHISSDDFEKMVVSIVKDKAPLSAPTATSPLVAMKDEPTTQDAHSGSTTTESSTSSSQDSLPVTEESQPSPTTTSAMPSRITPADVPVSDAYQTSKAVANDSIPEPSSSPAAKPVHLKKAPAQFALGGSCSSSEQSQSVDAQKLPLAIAAKKPVFQIGGSSEEDSSVKSTNLPAVAASRIVPPPMSRADSETAVDSDSEDDYVDESAIDDDEDSSDWEDSIEDSGKSSVDEKYFQRVESKAKMTSRPSLITLMLAQDERAKALGSHASQSTSAIPRSRVTQNGLSLGASPNDSDEGPLMMKGMRQSTLKPIVEIPRSSAQPIAAAPSQIHAQACLSPRTTRRHMLATELTESLRRNLLWERQQKTSTANAVLKRRHTSQDVANLQQFPNKACIKESEDVNASSWNQYFSKEALNGYHSKGW